MANHHALRAVRILLTLNSLTCSREYRDSHLEILFEGDVFERHVLLHHVSHAPAQIRVHVERGQVPDATRQLAQRSRLPRACAQTPITTLVQSNLFLENIIRGFAKSQVPQK